MKKPELKNDTQPLNETSPANRYSDHDLAAFREMLQERQRDARENYQLLQCALKRHDHDEYGSSPTFKLSEDSVEVFSMAEIAQYAQRLKKFLDQIDFALTRVKNKTYGICCITGELISKTRLSGFPQTIMTAEAKKKLTILINTTS